MKKSLLTFISLQALDMLISGIMVSAVGVSAEANPISAATIRTFGLLGASVTKFLATYATIVCMHYAAQEHPRFTNVSMWMLNALYGIVVIHNTVLLARLVGAILPYL